MARGKTKATIPWRPGQQAWLRQVTRLKQQVFTLCAFDDCIMLIKHDKVWIDNIILFSQCQIIWSIQDL